MDDLFQPGGAAAQILAVRPEVVAPALLNLADEVCTIGRARTCHIIVQQPLVSRLHARIERQGPRYLLADATSANGTYVNGGRLLGIHVLAHDDLIGLGSATAVLRFVDPDATVPAAGLLRYDERSLAFYMSGTRLELPPTQLRLLRHLYQHAGDICSRESCAQAVWGRDYDAGLDGGALDQAMNSLRKTLRAAGAQPDMIETRRSLGYMLKL